MEIVKDSMEEKNEKAVSVTEEQKPSYDQLKNWLDQVVSQRNQLAERLNQVSNIMNKLPWLFKVIENANSFTPEFVYNCTQEVQYILASPDEAGDSTEEENKKEVKD